MISAADALDMVKTYENAIRESDEYNDAMAIIEYEVTNRATEGYRFCSVDAVSTEMRTLIMQELKDLGFEVTMNGTRYMMIYW